MKYELKGFSKIFAFTFRQQTRRKGFLIALILVALLCLLGPALIMTGTAYFGQNSDDAGAAQRVDLGEEDGQSQDQALGTDALAFVDEIREILVVNETDDSAYSAEALSSFDFEQITGVSLAGVTFTDLGEDFEGARRQAADTDDTLILYTSQEGSLYQMRLLTLREAGFPRKRPALEPVLTTYGSMAADSYNAVHGLEEDGGMFDIGVHEGDADDPLAGAKSVLGFVLPYLNIMVLYFFVLIYGQSLAQSVIMEKTSKLMESFLVSVRPTAMIMGKLTAVCLCGVLQLGLWILCLIGGFYLGCVGVRAVDPDSDMLGRPPDGVLRGDDTGHVLRRRHRHDPADDFGGHAAVLLPGGHRRSHIRKAGGLVLRQRDVYFDSGRQLFRLPGRGRAQRPVRRRGLDGLDSVYRGFGDTVQSAAGQRIPAQRLRLPAGDPGCGFGPHRSGRPAV